MQKIIIFDFDGVLVDSFHPFYRLNRDAMASVGIKCTEQQYRNLYTGNVHRGFSNFISDKERLDKFIAFKNKCGDAYRAKIDFFPGAVEFIRSLSRSLGLGIVSSGQQAFIESILTRAGIRKRFYYISGSQSHTKTDSIREAMVIAGTGQENAFMVTDTAGDILAAKEAGTKTVAVTWGFHSLATLKKARPDSVVSDFRELSEVLT
jgi:phosphoglycolate phosphatase